MTPRRIVASLGVATGLLLSPAAAETLVVRSGEHDGFSRIVVAPAEKTAWRLGRIGAGYELRLERPGIAFDLTRAFDLIPRQRLSALSAGTVDGSIAFGLACDCHAIGFETASGAIVVDIVNGPARPDSGFETDLDARPATAEDATTRAPGTPATPLPFGPDLILGRNVTADPSRYWEGRLPAGDGAGATGTTLDSRPATAVPAEPGTETAHAPAPEATQPTAAVPATDGPNGASATPIPAAPDPGPVPDRVAKPDHGAQVPVGPPSTVGRNLRISETELDLLYQLGRAASQGLVTPAAPAALAPPAHSTAPNPDVAVSPAPEPAHAARPAEGVVAASGVQAAGAAPTEAVAIRSETSIDRAALEMRPGDAALTPDGAVCAPDDEVAVAAWGEADDPMAQLAAARATIVGEFDTPDPVAIVTLARLNVRLGFGAEALATLDAFDIPDDQAPLLRDLAHLVDGTSPDPAGRLASQTGCESDVALWALLARGAIAPGGQTARGAAIRAFSALPPHLRRALGPQLADIFLAAGEADAARSVRDATDRAAATPERAVDLIDARIDLSLGDTAAAQSLLDRLANGNDPTAREALIIGIETRLRSGAPVDALLAEAAAALGHEYRGTPLGGRLQRAAALALAANGAYGQAFDSLSAARDLPEEDRRSAELAIFDRITLAADDAVFLARMSAELPRFRASRPDPDLQLRVAGRLADAGLPTLVADAMDDGVAQSDTGRILRARAHLSGYEPEQALQVLDGLANADAVPLRARANDMLGNDLAAAEAFAAAGLTRDGAEAAMRAGDWNRAAALGDDAMRKNLGDLGLIAPPAQSVAAATPPATTAGAGTAAAPAAPQGNTAPRGPIASARDLVDASSRTRASIDSLLLSLP